MSELKPPVAASKPIERTHHGDVFVDDYEWLRDKTNDEVLDYLDRQADFGDLVIRLTELLCYLLPRYRRENRSYLSVAVGCTGGRGLFAGLVDHVARAA